MGLFQRLFLRKAAVDTATTTLPEILNVITDQAAKEHWDIYESNPEHWDIHDVQAFKENRPFETNKLQHLTHCNRCRRMVSYCDLLMVLHERFPEEMMGIDLNSDEDVFVVIKNLLDRLWRWER